MSFNFPNTPAPGDSYQPVGGPSYTWDAQKWVMTGSPLQVTPAYSQRNRIVNGAMQHSQENGNTTGVANPYYAVDQFFPAWGGTMALGAQRVQAVTPNGSQNRLRILTSVLQASIGATDYAQISTRIEGIRVSDFRWGTAQAKQVILRLGFKGPAGAYHVAIRNNTGARSYVAAMTISAGQANVDTEQIFVIPGDAAGTWLIDTSIGLSVVVTLASGTSTQGVLGWQAGNFFATPAQWNGVAASATWELFDVGLYLDPTASGIPPRWEMPDEAQELAACQRYWSKGAGVLVESAVAAGHAGSYRCAFPTPMRTTPAVARAQVSATNMSSAIDTLTDAFHSDFQAIATAGGNIQYSFTWAANSRM